MWNKEPATIINGLSGLLQQILPLLVVAGLLTLPPEKLAAWVSIIGLVLTFVSTVLIRSQVVPTETANSQIETAITMPSSSTVKEVVAANKVKEEGKDA